MAPTIVVLHEGLGSVCTWRNFRQQLTEATGAGVFTYSRPAHGHSTSITLSLWRKPNVVAGWKLPLLPVLAMRLIKTTWSLTFKSIADFARSIL